MEKGFNNDIHYKGNVYHIQTEDWGIDSQFVVSKVFLGGAVLRSVKTGYKEIAKPLTRQLLRQAMKDQHSKILDLVLSGQINP